MGSFRMKSTFKKLIAFIMLSVLLVVSAFAVYAAEATEEEIEAMQAVGFTNHEFAKALVENGVTPENYTTFDKEIDASNRGIKDITGVNKLVKAPKIDLSGNEIENIMPIVLLEEDGYYQGQIILTDNPTHIYPPNEERMDFVYNTHWPQSFALDTGRWYYAQFNAIRGSSSKKVQIDFGVTENNEYWYKAGNFTPEEKKILQETGEKVLYPYVAKNTGSKVGWQFKYVTPESEESGHGTATVNDDTYFQVRAPYGLFWYQTMYDADDHTGSGQSNSPEFRYGVKIDYYTPVKENVSNSVLGGIKLTKTDSKGNELDGAVFGLYDKDGKEVSKGTTKDGVIVWDGLELGNYTVIELAAPAGYLLDSTPIPVEVTGDDLDLSGKFEGGESKVKNVIDSETIELAPVWLSDSHANTSAPENKEYDLEVVSGSTKDVLASDDIKAYINNGGKTIVSFESEISLDNVASVDADLVLKLGTNEEELNPESVTAARETINSMINNSELTAKNDVISLTGSVVYQLAESTFAEVVCADKSACVYLEPIANKKLVGREIKDGEFGFEITKCDDEGQTVGVFSGVNAAAEAGEEYTVVNFFDEKGEPAVMKFCSAGLYEFTLREVVTDREEGMVYDETDRAVSVVVTESGSKGLMAEVYVDGKLVATVYSADTTKADNTVLDAGTVELATIVNRCTERANPSTGVPTMFSLVEILTAAGLGIVLKKKFF